MILNSGLDKGGVELCFSGEHFEVLIAEILGAISADQLYKVEIGSDDLLASTARREANRVASNREIAESNFKCRARRRVHSEKGNAVLTIS